MYDQKELMENAHESHENREYEGGTNDHNKAAGNRYGAVFS